MVTIPADPRRRLDSEAGDKLRWRTDDDGTLSVVETYERLNQSAGFEGCHAARTDFSRGVDLFQTYDGLSFGDASIAAHLERDGIEYLYSIDDDFDVLVNHASEYCRYPRTDVCVSR
jgi:bifunctional DNA-binding transcriptional regulator/antitoxin component of YhaV-PrlF toxin-antitoxin module